MTETQTEFHDAQGSPIHSGSGDQHITYVYSDIHDSVMSQARGLRLTLKDDLRWLKPRFVPPQNLGVARTHLRENRTVLLVGPPGSGRCTAAKMLLNELLDDQTPYAVLADEADVLDKRLVGVNVQARHLLVLDLTESTEEVFRARLRELPEFRAVMQQNDAYLVIAVPEARKHQIDDVLKPHAVEMGRPCGKLVLRRHLEAAGIFPTDRDMAEVDIGTHVAGPMREIADLVRDVLAERGNAPEGDPVSWLRRAVSADIDRSKEVSDQLKAQPDGRARTVLLAAAMFEGAADDAVFFASHRLVGMLNLDEDKPPRLEQDGYRTQLHELEIDVVDNRVKFGKNKYDAALRKYFWDNYPDLRQQLCEWANATIRMEQLTHRDRVNLVDRFASEALRTRAPRQLIRLIEHWVFPGPNGSNRLRDYGVRALLAGLRHERLGRWFRQLVYDWSRRDDLPAEVGQLVVDVCTEVIAPDFPDQAVVRLHHRARREANTGTRIARDALVRLVESDPLLLRLLLARLDPALQRQEPRQTDFLLFLDIADPQRLADPRLRSQPLAADRTVRTQLVNGWRAAMFSRPDLIVPRLGHWLAAAGWEGKYDVLLGILVEAASPSIKLLASLHVFAQDLSHAEDVRPEVAVRLSQLIDMAQGLHASDYTFDQASEETVR